MDTKEIISFAGPALSVVSLGFNVYFASKARAEKVAAAQEKVLARQEKVLAQEAARVAGNANVGQLETMLRTSIQTTRAAVREMGLKINDILHGRKPDKLNADEKRHLEPYEGALKEAVEANLNAYEDACGKFIDGKIDRDRFRKAYSEEIRTLCRSETGLIADRLHPESRGDFSAIWKVYKEWNILEK